MHQGVRPGTVLDTIRLRTRLSEIYNVNKQQAHANVLGEHGDTSFVAWSTATIAGVPLSEYNSAIASAYKIPNEYKREDVENYVRKSGGKIILRKGCTVYGIGMTSTHIVKTLSGNAEPADISAPSAPLWISPTWSTLLIYLKKASETHAAEITRYTRWLRRPYPASSPTPTSARW